MSINEMMCTNAQPAPTIAVCLGGSSRTFTNQLVFQSLRDNVLNSFGAKTTLFAYIKTHDARNVEGMFSFREQLVNGDVAQVAAVLKRLGAADSNVRILPVTEPLAPPPDCPGYPAYNESSNNQLATQSYRSSLIGQIQSKHECFNLISAHENSTGQRFTWVMFARPDLLWYTPVPAWCTISAAVEQGVRKTMWAFLFHRDKAEHVLRDPFVKYFGCAAPFGADGPEMIESWELRNIVDPDGWGMSERPGVGGWLNLDPILSCQIVRERTNVDLPGCFMMTMPTESQSKKEGDKWCHKMTHLNECNTQPAV
jgi:hypothetical protein